jgi:cobalt-zinc-cadmium efflux system protein
MSPEHSASRGEQAHGHAHAHAHAHAHGGERREDHAAAHRRGRAGEGRRVVAVLALTAVVLVAEVIGGLWSGSLALLSDAGHMLSDLAAQLLSLVALKIAARPSDARRTYGWYRVEILAALANGVALIALAGGILWSAIHRLRAGGAEIHTGLMISVAAVGLVANLLAAWLLHGASSLNVRGAYLHVLTDSLSSVAVVIGGVVMAALRGFYLLDPILSIAIGLFIVWSAWRLVREAVDVLLENVPADVDTTGVCRAIAACAGVRGVHDLHIWTITSGLYALSAHLVVDRGELDRSDALLTEVKGVLMSGFRIAHTTIQIESHEYEDVGHTCDGQGA